MQQRDDYSAVEHQHITVLDALRETLPDDAIVFGDITQLVYTGTAVEEKLSIPIVIWYNHSYAMIRDGMTKRGIPEIGVNQKAPDFINLAEAFGYTGIAVNSRNSFQNALQQALKCTGPSLIVVTENDAWLTG